MMFWSNRTGVLTDVCFYNCVCNWLLAFFFFLRLDKFFLEVVFGVIIYFVRFYRTHFLCVCFFRSFVIYFCIITAHFISIRLAARPLQTKFVFMKLVFKYCVFCVRNYMEMVFPSCPKQITGVKWSIGLTCFMLEVFPSSEKCINWWWQGDSAIKSGN